MAVIRHIQCKKIRSYHAGMGGVGYNKRRGRTACVSSVPLDTFFCTQINFCFENTL